MSLFDRIFGKRPKSELIQHGTDFKALTVYEPVFTNFNGQIYESELVRSAINARATHISKLKVEFFGHGSVELAKRLARPNAFNTWSQFLARTSTILDNCNGVIIVPVFDKFGRTTELYPVIPQRAKIIEVNSQPWVAFEFANGKYAQCPVWQVAMMSKFQFRNDFFGENNNALFPTMKLIDITNQGIMEGVKASATYRFMAQMTNLTKSTDLAKERKEFDTNNFSGDGGGLLLFPNTYKDIKQIDSKPFIIDDKQMEQIRKNVFQYFGVNEDVLTNTAYGDKWTAFYEGAIEPFCIQFSEVLTNMFMLLGELTGDGCGVMATANRLQYMSNAEKLNVSSQLADRGIINRDEVREIWNLPPLPNGEGKEYIIRGEYKNANEQITEVE